MPSMQFVDVFISPQKTFCQQFEVELLWLMDQDDEDDHDAWCEAMMKTNSFVLNITRYDKVRFCIESNLIWAWKRLL